MQAPLLTLALCALQLCPAVLGGPQHQRFVLGNGWPVRLSKVRNFAWQNCDHSAPAWVKSLNVIPDPVCIPGDVTVMASGTTTETLDSPLKVIVVLEKRIGDMWLKVPCVDQLGSCTYNDICHYLDIYIPPGQKCPEPLRSYGIPCHCPFKVGTYNLPPSDIYIPSMDLPSFLTNGDYRLKTKMMHDNEQLACLKLFFSLQSERQWFW
ncbi:ganglioside GM2 activator [Paroedura picta]|uniref:ganglioside GM2 activator n=1 Tax=Paroedura picta TaxID=143630 RepID=UPI001014103C